jgi:enolase 1/2/3
VVKIQRIHAREIIDSRGNPTIEVDVFLDDGAFGRASVPSGASVGTLEAVELRDGGRRYGGKGVLKAVQNVNEIIAPKIISTTSEQEHVDELLVLLDGTENKSALGANSLLAVSTAVAKAAAGSKGVALYEHLATTKDFVMPTPMMNIINGGAHANNSLDIQEFMIIPTGFKKVSEAIRCGCEIFHTLKNILNDKGHSTSVGDEGGFAPDFANSYEALDIISLAIERSGYKIGEQVQLALDVAASEIYKEDKYNIENQELSAGELCGFYKDLCQIYPIVSIEDPIAEGDHDGWKLITKEMGTEVQLVGDDLFVTNTKLLKRGIESNMANSILIKPNQIGTITETLQAIKIAQENNYKQIISHRSGETEDTTIAHIAVATGASYIKTGSLSRTDRIAKYNELLRIEEAL